MRIVGYLLMALVAVVTVALIRGAVVIEPLNVEQTRVIEAPQEQVQLLVSDFDNWQYWSPWASRDPSMLVTIVGDGVGSTYDWTGNEEVGKGRMTLLELTPTSVSIKLNFIEPFESESITNFEVTKIDDSKSRVRWYMNGEHDYPIRVIDTFFDASGTLEDVIQQDFSTGLDSMNTYAKLRAEENIE